VPATRVVAKLSQMLWVRVRREMRAKVRQTSTFEWVKYGKVRHETQRTPASGDTNSPKGVAGCWISDGYSGPSGPGELAVAPRPCGMSLAMALVMLSVVLSVGGGMIRHFTSFDVGR